MKKRYSCEIQKYILNFKVEAKTSRDSLIERPIWILRIIDQLGKDGIGEIAPLKGLSPEYDDNFEEKLTEVASRINHFLENIEELKKYPSILFGVETAWMNYKHRDFIFEKTDFTLGSRALPINALVWMGDYEYMKTQIDDILPQKPQCIKLKIGGIEIEKELALLDYIRSVKNKNELQIRLDANGAFSKEDAIKKLEKLAVFDIHSIEQPIATGQYDDLFKLCQNSPIPIALDEELIGIHRFSEKQQLIEKISPQYLVLKPSLHGGFLGTKEWIFMAKTHGIKFWLTSALESNIGLNAIAQWCSTYDECYAIPQGLGTGNLYENNFPSQLVVENYRMKFV